MNEQVPCPNCNGSGQIDEVVQTEDGPQPTPVPCGDCGGTGRA